MAIQAILAAVGVASSVVGFFKSRKESEAQQRLSSEQAALQRAVSRQSQKIEQVRKEQAFFDRLKTEKEILRQSQVARATAASRAVSQGAGGFVTGQGGGSSALQGAFGQVQGQTDQALTTLNTNFAFGQRVFDANARIAKLGGRINSVQSDFAASQAQQNFGKELFNFGANLTQNSSQYANTFSSVPGLFRG